MYCRSIRYKTFYSTFNTCIDVWMHRHCLYNQTNYETNYSDTMAIFSTISILVFTIFVSEVAVFEQMLEIPTYYDAICKNATKDPFFEDKTVIGKPWRVYFTWNMPLDEYCMEFTFKYADKLVSIFLIN